MCENDAKEKNIVRKTIDDKDGTRIKTEVNFTFFTKVHPPRSIINMNGDGHGLTIFVLGSTSRIGTPNV
jgi:hypothetical protein